MYKEIDSNKRRTVLLFGAFLIFVIGVGFFLSWYFNNVIILVIAVIIAFVQSLISYYYSDSIALAVSRAKEAPRKDFIELHRLVENLSITAGLPKPKIYVINDPSPNAFATGRDPKHASIAVTTGLLEKLDKTELRGVIAHEMSHIGNYDIRLMTVVVILVGVIALTTDFFLRWSFFGGFSRRDSNESGGQIIFLIIAIALAVLAPLGAMMIQLAISRKREFLADASGALLTRYPEGLASALEKISADPTPTKEATRATAHLFIADPYKKKVSSLFMTHPLVAERIKKLRAMVSK